MKRMQARRIVNIALKKARELDLKPVTVVVLDERGAIKMVESEDGSSMMRSKIAYGKAYGAIAMGVGSRALSERAATEPHLIDAISALAGGALVPVPGGVLARSKRGEVVGAVGVSGDTSDNDELCAMAGIAAASLDADAGTT